MKFWKKVKSENTEKISTDEESGSKNNEVCENIMNTILGKNISDNPLMTLSEMELRDLCKHYIETLESWSRRIIHELLKENYGDEYFDYYVSDGQPLVKKEIKNRVEKRMEDNPNRYPRKIDAILLEDIEYFLCRDDLYNKHFKSILEPFYSGQSEVRNVFYRLIPIRNKLSHSNTISIHEAEQCICYIDDLISTYKNHYSLIGKEKDYNVPVFLRIKDCFGNDIVREHSNYEWEIYCSGHIGPKIQLRSGDRYKIWIEVDSTFDKSQYDISWIVTKTLGEKIKTGTGSVIDFEVENKHVSYSPTIYVTLTTKKDWHRFGKHDDSIEMHLESVLPPIEDTY